MVQIADTLADLRLNASDSVSIPALTDRMADPMLMLDAQGIMRYCNASFEALVGRSVETFIGQPFQELLEQNSRRNFVRQWTQRPRGFAQPYLATWIHSDGNHVATKVFPTPLIDREGTFLGSIGVIVDWGKHQKARHEIEIMRRIASEGTSILYRARLAPGLPIEHISTNVQHLGYRAEDILAGRVAFADIIHEDDRKRVEEQIRKQAKSNATDFQHIFRVRTASGDTRWLQDHCFIRRAANGKRILEGLATDVTDAQVAREEHQQALLRTILALSSTVEKRDPYTGGHQQRVAVLSLAIACAINLDQHSCESIYLGAMVHDIGKLAVPAEILSKPTRLSVEEIALVKTHVQSGVEILRDIQLPWSVADIVAQHHERLDGSGYPAGLKGDEIAFEARIVAAADVVEAMSGHRPYRSARGLEAALNELHQRKAILYDERVVNACEEILRPHVACPEELWLRLEQDVGNWCQVHHLELIVEHASRT
jgi:PAS domain S-box-containing protein/putative nucleotidyltransferase with HDIG domain